MKKSVKRLRYRIKKGLAVCMEFEKLKQVIAQVLNVDPEEIVMETTFMEDLGADS